MADYGVRFLVILVASFTLLAVRASGAELRAGAAKTDITPPLGGRMYGYGARGANTSSGVHDPLYAKAMVLTDGKTKLAVVTLDLGSIDATNTAAVRDLLSKATDIDHVLLIASHTHSAPSFNEQFPSTEKPYPRDLERKIAEAVAAANDALQPAHIGVGWGRVEEGHNRRQVLPDGSVKMLWGNRARRPTSPVDYAVGVIAVNGANGEPVATLINYACHPVVLGPENLLISADYPGAMMAYVEKHVSGQAMFIQGAAGDINPFWDKTPPAEGGFEQAQKMGEAIAREVLRVRGDIAETSSEIALNVQRQVIPLRPRWDIEDPDVRKAIGDRYGARALSYYAARFKRVREAEVNTVLIGENLAIATFPGEFFVEHGLHLRRSSTIPNTIFAGYTNGALGYFPTIRAAAEGGYGAKTATVVEVGAGEKLVSHALIQLHYQAGKLNRVPRF